MIVKRKGVTARWGLKEAWSKTRGPMNKNRMRGLRCRASKQAFAKPISINGTGGKSGGRAWKAVELITGDLLCVTDT